MAYPNPIDPPPGCTFHPRCPKADDKCASVAPQPTVENIRLVECLYPRQLAGGPCALAELEVTGEKGPEIDPNWGEPGLSLSQKVYGWNTLEVIALECGNPSNPVHAIPPSAWARCHIRYVVGSRPQQFIAVTGSKGLLMAAV